MNHFVQVVMNAVPWGHVTTVLESIGGMAGAVSRNVLAGEPIAVGDWLAECVLYGEIFGSV
ncbi:hypothetical protein EN820_23080 [bacterium M00.F.Ca.ET.177.01.1.1]|nr:hypothetical protein EN842_34670 [bacterium M00.F.Ca.ET.199.01.1.1]TGT03151.1 hypothetical protein EN820_23080 [bacterium M00.F.Ca.ET.177.01.1.1]TGT58086.1 hypothetical protein EN813_036150 [Mesorhizobium sp. M00.F.Ca.ET.170.01.1.1]